MLEEPLSFLGGVDGSTGELRVGRGGNVAGKVLVFPKGKGSTVGSFVMYDLMVHGVAPAAVVNESAETIVATGAVISSIPMVDSVPTVYMFQDGDMVTVDADAGTVDNEGVEMRDTVSSAVMVDGKVLLLKRGSTRSCSGWMPPTPCSTTRTRRSSGCHPRISHPGTQSPTRSWSSTGCSTASDHETDADPPRFHGAGRHSFSEQYSSHGRGLRPFQPPGPDRFMFSTHRSILNT